MQWTVQEQMHNKSGGGPLETRVTKTVDATRNKTFKQQKKPIFNQPETISGIANAIWKNQKKYYMN